MDTTKLSDLKHSINKTSIQSMIKGYWKLERRDMSLEQT